MEGPVRAATRSAAPVRQLCAGPPLAARISAVVKSAPDDWIWAAAGHPHGVFQLRPQDLQGLTGAPLADVVQAP